MFALAIRLIVMMMVPAAGEAQTSGAPLVLEAKIPLGEVSSRIDHLAIDIKRQRLFVTELGNDTLDVVNLAAGTVLRTIADLKEPQGVAYVDFADSIYVANAGDGSVRMLRGDDLSPIGRIELGDDVPCRKQPPVARPRRSRCATSPASILPKDRTRSAGKTASGLSL